MGTRVCTVKHQTADTARKCHICGRPDRQIRSAIDTLLALPLPAGPTPPTPSVVPAKEAVAAASNPNASADELDEWSYDKRKSVLRAVASHANTGAETFMRLSRHKDRDVVSDVQNNAATPPEVLIDLARRDPDDLTWRVLTRPAGVPDEVIALVDRVERHSGFRKDLIARLDMRTRVRIAKRTGVPLEAERAIAFLRAKEWWTLTPDSTLVQVAKRVTGDS